MDGNVDNWKKDYLLVHVGSKNIGDIKEVGKALDTGFILTNMEIKTRQINLGDHVITIVDFG